MSVLPFVLSSLLFILAAERIMRVFFGKHYTPLWLVVLSYFSYSVVSSAVFVLFNIPNVTLATNVTMFFLVTLNYRALLPKRIIAIFCWFAMATTLETMMVLFFEFGGITVFYISNYNMWIQVVSGMFAFIVALLIYRLQSIRKNTITAPVFVVFILLIPILTMSMIFVIFAYLPQITSIVVITLLLGVNLSTFYFHDTLSAAYEDKLKSALHAQEKEYYFTQCKLMQESVENIRTIRHDMKMHLATARDFSIIDNADETTDYLNSLLGDIEKREVYSITNNTAFDSIINYKLNDAKHENIKLNIRILIPPTLNIEVADIVTILGNLLDNAIDAVAKIDDKQIKLDIEYSKESLFVQVENTFDGEVKYANGKDGIAEAITTRKIGDNHGYGLKNIRKSVEKYNGHVDINHEGNVFSVGVLLYIEDM